MAVGDVEPVPNCTDLYYFDTGMYDTEAYGSVYVLDADRPAVVDSGIGTNVDRLLEAMAEVGVDPDDLAYVLLTHVHLDHAGGAGQLIEACPNATAVVHEIGVDHVIDPARLIEGTKAAVGDQWEFYGEPVPIPADRIEGIAGGDEIDLGDRRLTAVAAPGHAPHQVMFHDDRDDALFTGDAAGIWVPQTEQIRETTPPSQFHLENCLADIDTIVERDPEVLCFGHFGPRAYDEALMDEYKRVLVEWVEAVRERRAELGDDDAVLDHFAATTEMGDVWGDRKARAEARLNVRGVLGYLDHVADAESETDGEA